MSPPSTTEILNRLLVLHERSLPMYLSLRAGLVRQPKAKAVLDQIVADQSDHRPPCHILESNGVIERRVSHVVHSLHDLSLAYLLGSDRASGKDGRTCERRPMANMAPTPRPPPAKPSAAKGHLENLQELQASLA
jgi:hypothetical protein